MDGRRGAVVGLYAALDILEGAVHPPLAFPVEIVCTNGEMARSSITDDGRETACTSITDDGDVTPLVCRKIIRMTRKILAGDHTPL